MRKHCDRGPVIKSSLHQNKVSTYSMSPKKLPVSVPFHSVFLPVFLPVSTVPIRSVHFRLPRANSFSTRHEFVCKIHCMRWRSVGRLFSTTRSRDGSYHEKGYRPRLIALFIARVRAGPRRDGSARAYLYFLHFIIE